MILIACKEEPFESTALTVSPELKGFFRHFSFTKFKSSFIMLKLLLNLLLVQ